MNKKKVNSKMEYTSSGKSNKKKNLTKKINGTEQLNLEAEDIVADAIKLNVDDDLNEKRDDNLTDCLSSKNSSNVQNGNSEVLDNANVEDEPNYEVDETEEDEQYMTNDGDEQQNENVSNHNITDSLIVHADESQCEIEGDFNTSNTFDQKSGSIQTKLEDYPKDTSMKILKENEKGDNKTIESKEVSNKDEKDRDNKKDGNATESDSKSSKSKSSPKDSQNKSISDKRTTSNDKNVWVSGLTSNIRASDLQSLFKKYGKVVGAKIIKNTRIPGSRCYGFITMETAEQAEKSIQNLNKTTLDGRTITVEKNRLAEDKKSSKRDRSNERFNSKDNKDDNKYKDKRDRSPRHRSKSPFKRFPHKIFSSRRPIGAFGMGMRGGIGGRFMNLPNPMIIRKIEAERLMRRREIRKQERNRVEDYRRQRDIERKQQEERDKLEREKIRLKIERDRLEREKAELLRVEREKARLERERLEREREELRRKQVQFPQRLEDVRNRGNNLNQIKRSYDDSYSWNERKRFTSNNVSSLRQTYPDLSGNSRYTDYDARPTDYEHRKFDVLASNSIGRDYEAKRSALESSRSSGHDKDSRRTTNGSTSQLSYFREPARTNISNRERDRRTSGGVRDDTNDWKAGTDRRSDTRFLEKNVLSETNSAPQSYLPVRGYLGGRNADAWSSPPDRTQSASSLGKLTYAPVSAITDSRVRAQPSIQQGIIGPTSTIGMYNPANIQMGGIISNPNYGNGNLGSNYRRYQ